MTEGVPEPARGTGTRTDPAGPTLAADLLTKVDL